MKALTEELQKNGMTDDASFAVIADKRCAGNVFYKLSSNSMLNLFGLQKQQMTKDERRKIQKVFEDLATEDCVSEKQLGGAQYLHKYSEKIFDKLQNFLERGSLELLEGNYYRFP